MPKRTRQETPKQKGKRALQGTPKLNVEVNVAKKVKGNGQENMTRNAKTRGQENAVGNAKGKGKENTAVKGQSQGERAKNRTGSLRGTLKCRKELWEPYLVSHSVRGKHWWVCIVLTCWQTITSQQSGAPGHPGKCSFRFLAVPVKIRTSLRAVITALGSAAALCCHLLDTMQE